MIAVRLLVLGFRRLLPVSTLSATGSTQQKPLPKDCQTLVSIYVSEQSESKTRTSEQYVAPDRRSSKTI